MVIFLILYFYAALGTEMFAHILERDDQVPDRTFMPWTGSQTHFCLSILVNPKCLFPATLKIITDVLDPTMQPQGK